MYDNLKKGQTSEMENEYVFLNGLKNLECTSFKPSSSNFKGVHTGDTYGR